VITPVLSISIELETPLVMAGGLRESAYSLVATCALDVGVLVLMNVPVRLMVAGALLASVLR